MITYIMRAVKKNFKTAAACSSVGFPQPEIFVSGRLTPFIIFIKKIIFYALDVFDFF